MNKSPVTWPMLRLFGMPLKLAGGWPSAVHSGDSPWVHPPHGRLRGTISIGSTHSPWNADRLLKVRTSFFYLEERGPTLLDTLNGSESEQRGPAALGSPGRYQTPEGLFARR